MKLSIKNKSTSNFIITLTFLFQSSLFSQTKPVVFKVPDSNETGDVILLYGGNLSQTNTVSIARLEDGPIGKPVSNTIKKLPTNWIATFLLNPSSLFL